MHSLQSILLIVKFFFVAGVLAALVWLVVRPMLHAWRQAPDPEGFMPKLPNLPDEELQIPVDPSGGSKPSREQMLKQLREDPRQTAMLLQHAIREKGRDRARKGTGKD